MVKTQASASLFTIENPGAQWQKVARERNLQPPIGIAARGLLLRSSLRRASMTIDRAAAQKVMAMLGFTLSFLLLMAIIALAFA
jgi:hypothetical protein